LRTSRISPPPTTTTRTQTSKIVNPTLSESLRVHGDMDITCE
jgi:hypothetical protein